MATARECRDCGNVFRLTREELQYSAVPVRCRLCRGGFYRRKEVVVDDGAPETLMCIVCGEEFEFLLEKAFFASMAFVRPRRCRFCRTQARHEVNE